MAAAVRGLRGSRPPLGRRARPPPDAEQLKWFLFAEQVAPLANARDAPDLVTHLKKGSPRPMASIS